MKTKDKGCANFHNINLVYHLLPNLDNLRGRKSHRYVEKCLKKQGWKIISRNSGNCIKGFPDLTVSDAKGNKSFVEIKTQKDGIRIDQIEFVRNNPKTIFIFLQDQSNEWREE